MKISNLSAELHHEGDEVTILFKMPVASFVSFVDTLKKSQPKKIRVAMDPAAKEQRIKEVKDKLYSEIRKFQQQNPTKYPSQLYKNFMQYWSEPTKDGKFIRYDKEKFFEIGKRLATYRSFVKPEDINAWWTEDKKNNNSQNDLFNNGTEKV